jgi:1,2-phenylacetyl-CoA epoxidase catalytic subunit
VSAGSAAAVRRDRALNEALFRYVLRLADTSLVLGQRLGEWVGHAPALEEDLGLANLALDLIGQARLLLTYAGEIEGQGRDEDARRSSSTSSSPSSRTGTSPTPSYGSG